MACGRLVDAVGIEHIAPPGAWLNFRHEMNPINESVPVSDVANPAAAIPNTANSGLVRGGIVVANIATEVFQYVVPGLFVMMGNISSAIREQKMKRKME